MNLVPASLERDRTRSTFWTNANAHRGGKRGFESRRSSHEVAEDLLAQRPRIRLSASSTARNSLASRRPADRPRRWGSTTVVCSTRTRVSRRSITIVGRKLAARALVEVGATSVVLRSRNSSACTITAKRAPRCSWPRVPRRGGKRKISPRTISERTVVRARPSARGLCASPRDRLRRQRRTELLRGSLI